MKILIADKLASAAVDSLESFGATVRFEPDLSAADLPQAIQDSEVLVVRSTKVTMETITAAKSLALVIRAGAGVNTIDLKTASSHGVYVCNCPGKNTAAVAELALGLMIAADRRIADATASLRSGAWKKKEFGKASGLKDRTLGILGMGAIGSALARAALAMDMRVIAWSRSLTDARAKQIGVTRADSPADLAERSDAVSVHLALTAETRHIVNAAFLERMKPGAILVNTSRGDLVDTSAVEVALRDRRLKFATDVFENEPEGGDTAFEQTGLASQITATPHIGASTDQASEAIAAEVVRIVQRYQDGETPPGVVNLCDRSAATHTLVVRHFNRVGVLASIMDGLRREDVNVEEMENVIFDGGEAACCTLQLDSAPSKEFVAQLHTSDAVLTVVVNDA